MWIFITNILFVWCWPNVFYCARLFWKTQFLFACSNHSYIYNKTIFFTFLYIVYESIKPNINKHNTLHSIKNGCKLSKSKFSVRWINLYIFIINKDASINTVMYNQSVNTIPKTKCFLWNWIFFFIFFFIYLFYFELQLCVLVMQLKLCSARSILNLSLEMVMEYNRYVLDIVKELIRQFRIYLQKLALEWILIVNCAIEVDFRNIYEKKINRNLLWK